MSIQSLFDLKGKVAIVTGGGNGIGRACCQVLSDAGADIVVADMNPTDAQETVKLITGKGGKAQVIVCNVLDDHDLVNLVNQTVKEMGRLNILVNVAGGGGGGRENPFKVDRAYFERIFDLNVFSIWRLCQLAVPHMAKDGYGSIVNISSMGSINNSPNMSAYDS